MFTPTTFKLISFELAKDLELNFYFEAALLLEAYQVMRHYQVPLARLEEFWYAESKKLVRFSQLLTDFLEREGLSLPPLAAPLVSGISLKKTPLGVFLFNLLKLKQTANLEAISGVFTSNFIQEDLVQRHRMDAKLRQRLHPYVDLKTYVAALGDFVTWQRFVDFSLPVQAKVSDWLSLIKNFFSELKVNISAGILQQLEQVFLPADAYLQALPYEEFLNHFNLFLEDTWVEPEDWQCYPELEAIAHVNPFIPAMLVREYGIEFPSPSFALCWLNASSATAWQAPQEGKAYRLDQRDNVLCDPGRLKLYEQAGGAAILSQQAACPFKAFGHFQLKLQPLVVNEAWLSAKLKGIAVHRILEKIWGQLKSQRALLNLDAEALTQLVQEITANVVFGLSHHLQFFLPASLARLEVRRLQTLILAWLEEEKKRPEFKIHALEIESLAYLGDLVVKLRLDRVDELMDGQRLVLDYKTGSVDLQDWLSEPLGDVQLPLYVLTTGASGALLAEVNQQLHFSGIVAEEEIAFSEVGTAYKIAGRSWDDLKAFWQKHIQILASEISAGVARVRPVKGACDYCDLHAVCRVKEKNDLNTSHPSPLPPAFATLQRGEQGEREIKIGAPHPVEEVL